MALIAIHAVVNVPTNIGMIEIRRIIVAMTTGALEHGVVARIRVAGGTNTIRVPMVCGEVRVVECGSGPCGRRMASITGRREASRCVVRIRGPVVVRLMTSVAIRGQRRVVVVHVALRAGHVRRVISRQREGRRVVIEGGARPIRSCPGGVASVASCREAHDRVRRVSRAVVVRLMTGNARRARQTVSTRWAEGCVVALRALQRCVRALQGKARGRVIEGRTRPTGGRVALIARGRESRLDVTRIRCPVEIGLMALYARSRVGQAVCPARTKRGVMALCAL